jgi:broad specificity phosphatase PhoE
MDLVILVRHGETEYNVGEPRLRGHRDIPLTAKGKKEAVKTAEKLVNQYGRPDKLYTSPLQRAAFLGREVSKLARVPLIVLPGAISWNHGSLTGQKASSVANDMNAFTTERRDQAPPGGESFNDLLHRWIGALSHVMSLPGHLAVICTHLQNCMTAKQWVENGQPKDLIKMPYRYAKENEIEPSDFLVLKSKA